MYIYTTTRNKKRVSYLYRTAATTYPCFLPNLGDLAGAGRTGLTRLQRYYFSITRQRSNTIFQNISFIAQPDTGEITLEHNFFDVIIVADSGATKTTWYYSSPETSGTATTCGLHPDIIDGFTPSDYDKILPLMNKSGKIYFYGSGCATSKRQEVVYQWLKTRFPLYDIVVQSDLIASAISLYGQQSGIVGILGTGASMAIWDNQTMTLPIPSLGWTIGDEGSGFDIAKRFFKAWYSGKFPKQVNTLLDKNRQMPNAIELLNNIHKHGHPNKKIASFCTEISQLTHFAPIRSLIEQAFHDYFDYYNNILVNKANRPIGFTGGVAHGFKAILMATAKSRGLDIFSVIDNPIKKLAAFHIADYSGLSNSF